MTIVGRVRIIAPTSSDATQMMSVPCTSRATEQKDFDLDYSDEESVGEDEVLDSNTANVVTSSMCKQTSVQKNIPLPIAPTIMIDEVSQVVAKKYRYHHDGNGSCQTLSTSTQEGKQKDSDYDSSSNLEDTVPDSEQPCSTLIAGIYKSPWSSLKDMFLPANSDNSTRSNASEVHDIEPLHDISVGHVVMEGWVKKKGSGRDMLGNKNWKQRYVRLAVAQVPNYQVDVPILLVSWHSTINPSMIIVLDSRQAIPVNGDTFDIVESSASGKKLNRRPSTVKHRPPRTFSSAEEDRDLWVKNINDSIWDYEKRSFKALNLPPTPPRNPRALRRRRRIDEVELEGLKVDGER